MSAGFFPKSDTLLTELYSGLYLIPFRNAYTYTPTHARTHTHIYNVI